MAFLKRFHVKCEFCLEEIEVRAKNAVQANTIVMHQHWKVEFAAPITDSTDALKYSQHYCPDCK